MDDDPALLPNKPRGGVDDRRVLNGIFWILRSGSPWADLPERYGPPTTVYMPQNANCPKFGRPMTPHRKTRAPHPADDRYVFECAHWKTTYATKDNIPSAGPRDD